MKRPDRKDGDVPRESIAPPRSAPTFCWRKTPGWMQLLSSPDSRLAGGCPLSAWRGCPPLSGSKEPLQGTISCMRRRNFADLLERSSPDSPQTKPKAYNGRVPVRTVLNLMHLRELPNSLPKRIRSNTIPHASSGAADRGSHMFTCDLVWVGPFRFRSFTRTLGEMKPAWNLVHSTLQVLPVNLNSCSLIEVSLPSRLFLRHKPINHWIASPTKSARFAREPRRHKRI
jgi:hypothetical protein